MGTDEQEAAVPNPATPAEAQPPQVEQGNTAPPPEGFVPLADFQAVREEIASLKAQQQKAQSEQDKRRAKLTKSFRRELEAIATRAPREGWDEEEQQTRREALTLEYARKAVEADAEDQAEAEAAAQQPVREVAPPPQPAGFGAETDAAARAAMLEYLTDYGVTEQEFPIAKYLRTVQTNEEMQALNAEFWKDLRAAKAAKQVKVEKTADELEKEVDAENVAAALEQYGAVGGMSSAGGSPSSNTNKKTLDTDLVSAYYEKYRKGGRSH